MRLPQDFGLEQPCAASALKTVPQTRLLPMTPRPPARPSEQPRLHAMLSDPGRVRHTNEDTCGASPEHGASSSATAWAEPPPAKWPASSPRDALLAPSKPPHPSRSDATRRLADAIRSRQPDVFTARPRRSRALRGMGTTLVGLLCASSSRTGCTVTLVAHVGDSRCYRLRAQSPGTAHPRPLPRRRADSGRPPQPQPRPQPPRSATSSPAPSAPTHRRTRDLRPAAPARRPLPARLRRPHPRARRSAIARILPRIRHIRTSRSGNPPSTRACRALVDAANAHGGARQHHRPARRIRLTAPDVPPPLLAILSPPRHPCYHLHLQERPHPCPRSFTSRTSTSARNSTPSPATRSPPQEIKEFGQKYDPQPFHLDETAGEGSFFKGLAASGWLTAAIVMRLRVQSITVAGGMIGAGVEEMRWTEPVRPGDTLRSEIEVLGVRHSAIPPRIRHRTTRSNCLQPAQRDRHARHRQLPRAAPLAAVKRDVRPPGALRVPRRYRPSRRARHEAPRCPATAALRLFRSGPLRSASPSAPCVYFAVKLALAAGRRRLPDPLHRLPHPARLGPLSPARRHEHARAPSSSNWPPCTSSAPATSPGACSTSPLSLAASAALRHPRPERRRWFVRHSLAACTLHPHPRPRWPRPGRPARPHHGRLPHRRHRLPLPCSAQPLLAPAAALRPALWPRRHHQAHRAPAHRPPACARLAMLRPTRTPTPHAAPLTADRTGTPRLARRSRRRASSSCSASTPSPPSSRLPRHRPLLRQPGTPPPRLHPPAQPLALRASRSSHGLARSACSALRLGARRLAAPRTARCGVLFGLLNCILQQRALPYYRYPLLAFLLPLIALDLTSNHPST